MPWVLPFSICGTIVREVRGPWRRARWLERRDCQLPTILHLLWRLLDPKRWPTVTCGEKGQRLDKIVDDCIEHGFVMNIIISWSSVYHECIMYIIICVYVIASSPKRLPFPRQTRENIQVKIWPFWRGNPVFLTFAFLGGYSCHLAFNELLLGFDVFFPTWLGWDEAQRVPQIIWRFTEKCQVILGIHDMDHQCMTSWTSWRRETQIHCFQ